MAKESDIIDRVALWGNDLHTIKLVGKLNANPYFDGWIHESPKEILRAYGIENDDEFDEHYGCTDEMNDIQKVITVTQHSPHWGEWLCGMCASLGSWTEGDRKLVKDVLIKSLEIAVDKGIDS